MKKKLLLIALPLFMALSGCAGLANEPAEQVKEENIMLEDNLAHEELFGAPVASAPKQLGEPAGDAPGADPSWTKMPKIGVQFKLYERDVDPDPEVVSLQSFYAVRYVAAIAGLDGGVTASWTRGVSEKDSTQVGSLEGDHNSTVAYDTLNNNGTPVAATSEGTGYNKYVVYTAYNIPLTQDESYIAAFLTLSKEGEEPVKSKVVAAQMDGSYCFSFESSKNGYFLQGTLGGVANTIWDETESDTTDPYDGEKNNSLFEEKTFAAGDKFGLFRFTPTLFQFFGHSTFASSTSARFIKSTTIDQFNELYLPGTYTLYVNYINMIYTAPVSVDMDLYLVPNDNWKQDGDGHAPRFALNAFGASDNDWFDLVETGEDTGIYKVKNDEKINLGKYTTVIFCRMNGNDDKLDNTWANKYNQTKDLVINDATGPGNMSLLKYCVEGWDNGNGTWEAL